MSPLTRKKFKILMDNYPSKDVLEEIYLDSCIINRTNFTLEDTIDDLFDHWMVKEGLVTLEELENQV